MAFNDFLDRVMETSANAMDKAKDTTKRLATINDLKSKIRGYNNDKNKLSPDELEQYKNYVEEIANDYDNEEDNDVLLTENERNALVGLSSVESVEKYISKIIL